MCGIAGYVSLTASPPDSDLVRRMTARLVHRGPDGEGFFDGSSVALGHRRLSILDLARGAQPMRSGSGRSVLVHNGEIYNSPALRNQLRASGRGQRTHSDTEVIVEGIEAQGEAFLPRLNGIFAFAWHRESSGLTLLARDPFGVKPLYYHRNAHRLLFASEIRALLADPEIRARLDRDELNVLLTLRYSPSPGTLFQGIHKVPPGHVLRIEQGRVEESRYDLPSRIIRKGHSLQSWAEAYEEGVREAVSGQMLSDVPVGVFLSGGVDSTAVAGVMREKTPGMSAFTVGFDEAFAADEREAAAHTSSVWGLRHLTESCTPEAFVESLPEVVRRMEEPVGSASAVPFWMLARLASRTHKVVLTGQGADEPHGGYPRYQGVLLAQMLGALLPATAGAGISRRLRGRAERLRRGVSLLGLRDPARILLETYRHFPREWMHRLLRDEWKGNEDLAARRIARWREPVAQLDPLAQMLHVDARMWLADDLLLYGDKLSMAHGLEVRVPYLDRELMRLVEEIPRPYRVSLGRPKRLHRAALRHLVPPAVFARRKLGFETPVDLWFRTRWVPELPGRLWGKGSFLPTILRVEAMKRMVAEHESGSADHQRRLYTLLALELWGREFL